MKIWLSFLLLSLAVGCKPEPVPKMDMSSIRSQLESAAERALPTPTLSGKTVEITVEEMEARISSILKLATDLGGKAMRGLDRADSKIVLATIPQGQMEIFEMTVKSFDFRSQPAFISRISDTSSREMMDCEVVLKPRTP